MMCTFTHPCALLPARRRGRRQHARPGHGRTSTRTNANVVVELSPCHSAGRGHHRTRADPEDSDPLGDSSALDSLPRTFAFTGTKTTGIGLAFNNFSPTTAVPEPASLLPLASGLLFGAATAWLPLTAAGSVPGRRRSRSRSTGAVIRSRLIRSLRTSPACGGVRAWQSETAGARRGRTANRPMEPVWHRRPRRRRSPPPPRGRLRRGSR